MSWESNETKMVLVQQDADCQCEANLIFIIQCYLVISLAVRSQMKVADAQSEGFHLVLPQITATNTCWQQTEISPDVECPSVLSALR